MRVLQVNSVAASGSTGRLVRVIAHGLSSGGHEPWIAYGRGKGLATTHQMRIGGNASVLHHVAVSRLLDAHGLGSAGATRRLVKALSTMAPDVVHLHNVHGYYLNYPLFLDALRKWGGPVVWTLHDCWAFTGHCAYFEYVGCDKWRTGCGDCPQLQSYPSSWVVDRTSRNHRLKAAATSALPDLTLVTPSRWLRGLVKRSFLSERSCYVIPNDPDGDTFRPTAGSSRQRMHLEGRYVMLAVANVWEPRKGLDTLLRLAETLREDETLLLVGPLPSGTELPPRVVSVDHTDDGRHLAELYTAADVFLNPTLEDNYPTTNLEALACGTPVITFDTGGAKETVERGVGISVSDRTPAGLRAAVDRWRDAEPFSTAESLLRYEGSGMVSEYLALYDQIVAGRNGD